MKIVLIELPHVYLMQQKTQAPLGLMYLASVLEKNNIDVEIKRLVSLNLKDKENFIPEADIYGISSVSLDYSSAKEICKRLKKENKVVIIGGYHATAEIESVKNDKIESGDFLWDSVCSGEFEITILDVVRDFSLGKLKRFYFGKRVSSLDTLPFPARHLIKEQGSDIFAYDKHYSKNKLSTVICSSRGCPFNCCFCSTRCMWGGNVRYRSAENMINEIKHCIDEYGIREFRFSDELFTVNKKRVKELMEWFKNKRIYWKCSTRSDCVDEFVLQSMKDGGCMEIAFGVESADSNVLNVINKKSEVKDHINALKLCEKIGIETRVLMMINTPGETIDTVQKNIDFLDTVPYTCASLSVFKPLPGSPVWNNPEFFGIEIFNKNLDDYNIYMWIKGELEENNSEDVFRIKSLPSIESQIDNRKRMIEYFYKTEKMNELFRALKQKKKLKKNDKMKKRFYND